MGFAPSSTTRWFLKYDVTGGGEHVVQLRSTSSATAEQVSTAFDAFLGALDDQDELYETNIIELSRAATGSNAREPQSWTGEASYGSGSVPLVIAPRFIAFSGRAMGNQQVRLFLYNWIGTTPDDFRLSTSEDAGVAAAVAVLAAATNVFLSAGLNQATWKPYANIGFSAYYQRIARVAA